MIHAVYLLGPLAGVPTLIVAFALFAIDWLTGRLARERAELKAEQAEWERKARERAEQARQEELQAPIRWEAALAAFDRSAAGRRLIRLGYTHRA